MNVLIIGGEVSGDMHGARLISELRKINHNFAFFGIGGDQMINAGLNATFHINQMSFLGFYEVIKHLPFILHAKRRLLEIVKKENIKLAILIDYPGFNLNIAKSLKKLNLRIVYYISPQIWAWGKHRLTKIKKLVDKMLVVFPFEKEFYSGSGINVSFVGHPLVERIDNYKFLDRSEFFQRFNLDIKKEILLLMPGSRKHEIELIFPAILPAAKELAKKFNLQLVVALNEEKQSPFTNEYKNDDVTFISGKSYELMKYSKFGIIKSGTSTLEAALIGLPFVVVYKISTISYLIGKLLISINNIAMPNIILGKTVVPEIIQSELTLENIVNSVQCFLNDEIKLTRLKSELTKIKNLLSEKRASFESANIIAGMLNER